MFYCAVVCGNLSSREWCNRLGCRCRGLGAAPPQRSATAAATCRGEPPGRCGKRSQLFRRELVQCGPARAARQETRPVALLCSRQKAPGSEPATARRGFRRERQRATGRGAIVAGKERGGRAARGGWRSSRALTRGDSSGRISSKNRRTATGGTRSRPQRRALFDAV